MATDLTLANRYAHSLAASLMVPVTVFRSEAGYGVVTSDDIAAWLIAAGLGPGDARTTASASALSMERLESSRRCRTELDLREQIFRGVCCPAGGRL